MLRSTVLPRRLTQLFADNKKSYEALVQPRQSGPELSHLHLKLRIQKDRLIAWGIQWSDRSTATQTGDIDQSLDKAGISDLVASIMCSIRELLDEAESLQPPGVALENSEEWTSTNIRRLEEILKDLTTSIDTLCDLSRSKVEGSDAITSSSENQQNGYSTRTVTTSKQPADALEQESKPPLPPRRDDLTDLAYIDPTFVRQRTSQSRSSASPPSYESVATGSENRVVAYFSPPSPREASSGAATQKEQTTVLLDYGQIVHGQARGAAHPDRSRFEELLLALLKFPSSRTSVYTGVLKLTGWTSDASKSRSAFVYEIPPFEGETDTAVDSLQPRSLLSFLQNGGDADSNNIPSLENRLKLALNVTLSILHLHEVNVTHRNLTSNNLLFFLHRHTPATQDRVWKTSIIRKPYLTGFYQSGSILSGSRYDVPFTGLYHHPVLGNDNGNPYQLAHDYYSLGLVLLEIGLWMPIGKFWKSRYSLWDFKARLQDIYLKKLSAKCGEGYMNAVLSCITAADQLSHSGENGETPGAKAQLSKFRETVVAELERCCRMDKSAEPLMSSHTPENLSQVEAADLDVKETELKPREPEPSSNLATNRSSTATVVPDHISVELAKKVAKEQAKIRVWSHELPTLYLDYWTTTMFPKLERILRKALSRMESYTIDLFMAGRDPDTARPTVYMECTSTSKCQRILRHLNKELRLFEIKVVSGQVVRSKGSKKKRKGLRKQGAKSMTGIYEHNPSAPNLNPQYQEQPICGASIGAYVNGSHLPPVTFGGAVLVDGEPFGMSVHHMLEDDEGIEVGLEDRIDSQRSMAPRESSTKIVPDAMSDLNDRFGQLYPFEVSESPEMEDTSSIGYPCSSAASDEFSSAPPSRALYPFEITDGDLGLDEGLNEDDLENDFWLSPNFDAMSVESDDEDNYELGDTDGILPGQDSLLAVTQPALDDVHEGFFPSPEDMDSEHLTSHSFGYVHASSGLRRSRDSDFLIHEIDWALIRIHPERLPGCLKEASPSKSLLSEAPLSILPSPQLAARSVHSHTRSSGLFARGTILPTMRLVRMPGRISPSHSWQIRGSFGGSGDSGAWVFDDTTGAVCGHVLAYSEKSEVAYIAPMDVMMEDMQRVLGVGVGLPGMLPLPEGTSTVFKEDDVLSEATTAVGAIEEVTVSPGKGKTKLGHEPANLDPSKRGVDKKRGTPSPALPTSPPVVVSDRKVKGLRKDTSAAAAGGAKGIDGMRVGVGVVTRV